MKCVSCNRATLGVVVLLIIPLLVMCAIPLTYVLGIERYVHYVTGIELNKPRDEFLISLNDHRAVCGHRVVWQSQNSEILALYCNCADVIYVTFVLLSQNRTQCVSVRNMEDWSVIEEDGKWEKYTERRYYDELCAALKHEARGGRKRLLE